jgi:uncharacterized protein YecE (DUF72 family)
MSSKDDTFYLGTSGWAHRDWVGQLYPHEMSPAEYLTAYAQHFRTVELEHTRYNIPTRHLVQSWYHRTPAGFRFSPCLPRAITHDARLQNIRGTLDNFLAVMTELGDKLGPILVQLPETFRSSEQDQLETFLSALPQEVPFAIEFRHGSWLRDATFTLLEAHQVAWVVVDAPFLPRMPRVTANFAYVRWHGHPGTGQRVRRQTDPAAAFHPWVPILRHLARQTVCVYGYVRNSFSGYAPRDCATLLELLGEKSQGQGGG